MPVKRHRTSARTGNCQARWRREKLVELAAEPSLEHIAAFAAASVGEQATNIIPDKAEASIEARLVKGEDPRKKCQQSRTSFANKASSSSTTIPRSKKRREHARVIKVIDREGYRASRLAWTCPLQKRWSGSCQHKPPNNPKPPPSVSPMLGGSVPMYIFETSAFPGSAFPSSTTTTISTPPTKISASAIIWHASKSTPFC